MKMLNWVTRFNIFCFLDNNKYEVRNEYEWQLATDPQRSVKLNAGSGFNELKSFYNDQPGWLFGHIGYELNAEASLTDTEDFESGYFFSPGVLLQFKNEVLTISSTSIQPEQIYNEISGQHLKSRSVNPRLVIKSNISRTEYINKIRKIREHILRGDCYELNFCQHFYADEAVIDPLQVFNDIQQISPNPFSAFYRVNDNYCICASPERFIKKQGQVIISQPIKGTSKRSADAQMDLDNKNYLINSIKEKSENVMVVDLVRNDLSKVCEEGSVDVEELFGIYTFPQVYQMISTIRGVLQKDIAWTELLDATFPMGSMTGAPKKRVMELIAKYEEQPRGLFSGSIGYVSPDADLDFNVVIRSIFYNQATSKLYFKAGSGITFYSDPESEYTECLMKAAAIVKVLES